VSAPVPRLTLTLPELAEALHVDRRTVYRLIATGELPVPVIRVGRSPRVRVADLEAHLEQLAEAAREAGSSRRRSA